MDSEYFPVWQRIQRDGAIVYRPDLAHPVFADFSGKLPVELQAEFASLIALIGSSVPVASLHSDFAGSPEEVKAEDADEQSLRQLAEAMIPRLLDQGTDGERIAEILCQVEPFKSASTVSRSVIGEILDRETRDV